MLNLITADNFNRVGNLPGSVTTHGQALTWAAFSGSATGVQTDGSVMYRATAAAPGARINVGTPDFEVSAKVTLGTVGFVAIAARCTSNAQNFYRLRTAPNGVLAWVQVVAATSTNAQFGPPGTVVDGDTIMLRVQGTTATAFLNGVQIGSAATIDASLTEPYAGVHWQNSGDGTIDDFQVRSIFPTTYVGTTPIIGAYQGEQIVRKIA